MRFGLGILGFVVVAGTTAAFLSACGSTVTELPGGNGGGAVGGAGGSGGTTMTTVVSSGGDTTTGTGTMTTTTTVSSSSSVASSSSSGGDSACVQDCALVKMCFGFDGCSQFGIDCANPNPQAKCVIDCIGQSNPTCQDIQGVAQMCFGACQNMGTTTSSASASSSGGGGGLQCQTCAAQKCGMAAQACFQNQACQGWLQCTGGCQQANMGPDCYTACDTQYASAKPQYDAVYACTCTNCPMQCAGADPCNHGP